MASTSNRRGFYVELKKETIDKIHFAASKTKTGTQWEAIETKFAKVKLPSKKR
jgi:hypothetical protein